MTNKYSAYAHSIPGGLGYWAMTRLCRDAHPSPIMDAGDKPKVFGSKGEAAEECLKHMLAFMNGREIRGEMFDVATSPMIAARSQAERLFMGGGKTIKIERLETMR
ncbi:hypothetical protein G6L15_08510 [Agrobacterium rhizogenes]|uniref:hypothetical protein n=1 Tax=Rhizobium rhizogenes TaxID=359 RepID=UPI001571B84B|nr:hypothetical protein [Rhizobium rhizogenes]NTG86186.1 hypothetical protein [Rhizobium rhizogenes]